DLFKKQYNDNEFIIIKSSEIYDIFENNFIAISKDLKEKIYIDYLWSLMIKLRYNCLWDKKQTSLSIKNHLIEEAYEVFDSINSPEKLKEELGDLLLQIIFHSQINYDEKKFSFIDVVESLINKLIYRHPHIFENLEVNDISNLLINWENLKNKEKNNNQDIFINLPKALPSFIKLLLIFRKFKRINKLDFLLSLINSEIEDFINNYLNNKNDFSYSKNIRVFFELITDFTKENINLEEILNKFINNLLIKINNKYKSQI
ncbi:MAG: MazG nucleotide pyrophosphohydrolase domain-containing protein, partial [Candidatus Methanomethylicia archaeon]